MSLIEGVEGEAGEESASTKASPHKQDSQEKTSQDPKGGIIMSCTGNHYQSLQQSGLINQILKRMPIKTLRHESANQQATSVVSTAVLPQKYARSSEGNQSIPSVRNSQVSR
jgi:hypothetical protein